MSVKLVWATPNIDSVLGYIARVSNPANQDNPDVAGLLRHMEREGHVSPFTMANICVEVNTTRAIGRQMIRHWTLAVQEFSQRYQDVSMLGEMVINECRMQDDKNRQSSLPCDDPVLAAEFEAAQREVYELAVQKYNHFRNLGVAKECVRTFLPEGNTPSRLYFNGTVRSWIHYLRSRTDMSTQKEHRVEAVEIAAILQQQAPITYEAFFTRAAHS